MRPEVHVAAEGPFDWSIVSGFTPLALTLLALAALVFLVYGRDQHWWARWVPVILLATVGVSLGIGLFVDRVWQPFPDNLPTDVVVWIGVTLGAVILGLVQLFRRKTRRPKLLAAVAMLVLVIFGLNQINRVYDQYPTLRDAFRALTTQATPLKNVLGSKPLVVAPAGTYLSAVWHPPADMPSG